MSSKRCMRGLLIFAVALLASPGAAQAQTRPQLTEEFHQSYTLAPGGRVSLGNINGKVHIKGWDRNEVRVDAVKRAYTPERLREAEIKVNAAPNYVRIETEYPDGAVYRRDNTERDNPFAAIEYTLSVPRGARLEDVNLVNGPLVVEGITGPVQASAVNGPVTARNLTGRVRLSVVNGRLDASFDRLSEGNSITLGSVNGPVVLTLPSDVDALLKAGTVSGAISNDFGLPVRVGDYVGRNLEGQLGNGGPRIKLDNVSGSINIRRAADGRTRSTAVNLLSETRRSNRAANENEGEAVISNEELKREVEEGAREAQRELEREKRQEQRAAERGEHSAQRAAERRRTAAERESMRDTREAVRETERAAARIAADAAKIAREVQQGIDQTIIVRNSPSRRIERETYNHATNDTPRIRIESFAGPVTVHGWDKPEVAYTVVKRAFDENEMKGIKVSTRASNNRRTETPGPTTRDSEILIRTDFDKEFAHLVEKQDGRVVTFVSTASVELDVYVPRGSLLNVVSGDGRLRVEGLSGQMELQTGDGPVDVTESRGRVRIVTGDGRIRIEGFDGEADARTGDGRITLDGRFVKLAARTGDGTISLTLPENLNANLETNATSVVNDGVAVAEDSGEEEQRVRRWRIGGGGNLFTLRTGSGQVILRRR